MKAIASGTPIGNITTLVSPEIVIKLLEERKKFFKQELISYYEHLL
ncbi:MAG: hypothetical protein WBH31_15105 [Promethearchaeia archaeon]